jgi:hypothetical protein
MSGLPPNMDCSLLGSDNKEGTVPMAVVPFSNRMYIYIISSSLFVIFSAIVFYVFKPKKPASNTPENPPQIISIITAIIGITSVVLYNLYNNTPATFNFLFFGMMGIIITFCLLVYLIIRDKYYLMNSIMGIIKNVLSAIGGVLSAIGSVLANLIKNIRGIEFINVGSFINKYGVVLFGVAVVSLILIALLASFGGIKTSTTR